MKTQENKLNTHAIAWVAFLYVILYLISFFFVKVELWLMVVGVILLNVLLIILKIFFVKSEKSEKSEEKKYKGLVIRLVIFDFIQIFTSLIFSIVFCTQIIIWWSFLQSYYNFQLYALAIITITIIIYKIFEYPTIKLVKNYGSTRRTVEQEMDFTQIGTIFASALSIMYLGDISFFSQPDTDIEDAQKIGDFMTGQFMLLSLAYIYLIIQSLKRAKLFK